MGAEEDATKYEAHFAKYIADGKEGDKIEEMYADAHKKIRANPEHTTAAKKDVTITRKGNKIQCSDGSEHVRSVKLSLKQRQAKVQAKIAAAQAKMAMED